jgi:hypothetical protein
LLALGCGPAVAAAPSPREIAADITPAVLSIASYDQWGEMVSTGTGFFLDHAGTFATNHHVLEGAATLSVELASGARYDQVLAVVTDPERDIAILRIDMEGSPAVRLGADEALQVGDTVYVMGNPLGLDRTFSNGLVSARRHIEDSDVIQITAPISPGSSGGPVMNDRGQVVGIATWYVESGQNLNMAVPISYVRPLLEAEHTPAPFAGNAIDPVVLSAEPSARSWRRRAARINARRGDQWTQQVLEQLAAIEEAAADKQLVRSHEPVTGELRDGQSSIIRITLEQGHSYYVAGVCDKDCDDLDLFLYGAGSQLLAEDKERTDFPVVAHEPEATGELQLRVRMYSCHVEPCAFGVAVFEQR